MEVPTQVSENVCGYRKIGQGTHNRVPYVQKYPNEHGNVCEWEVAHPAVLSTYYAMSNTVDKHNHLRQHILALETAWVTCNQWFRVFSTVVGIRVIDSMKLYCHSTGRNMPTATYINRLFYQLLRATAYTGPMYNCMTEETVVEERANPMSVPQSVGTLMQTTDTLPYNTPNSTPDNHRLHIPTPYPYSNKVHENGHLFRLQRACNLCKSKGLTRYTSYQCKDCRGPLFRDGVGNRSWGSTETSTSCYCFREYHSNLI